MKFLTSGCLLAAAALSVVRAAPISNEEIADMTSKGFRLLDLEAGVDPVWKTEDEILDLLRADIGFVSPAYWMPYDLPVLNRAISSM